MEHPVDMCKCLLGLNDSSPSETHLGATERHLPQCYLPLDTGKRDPPYTTARQAGSWCTYSGGMEDWVDLGVGYILRWFIYPETGIHPCSSHLISTDQESNPRPSDRKFNTVPCRPTKGLQTSNDNRVFVCLCLCISAMRWSAICSLIYAMDTTSSRCSRYSHKNHWSVKTTPTFICIPMLFKGYSFSRETHLEAADRQLPWRIAQCYLPPDTTSERATA